jgi:23S rRNA pseudouridine1911/1915/1917 synthase
VPTDPETRPLLDWVLQRYPDTPKSRAKQWIQAGRVTVNGAVLRKPHQVMADPGEGLLLGGRHQAAVANESGWRIHPRVLLIYLDFDLAVVNKGPGLVSVPAANAPLSALSILADFLVGKIKAPRARAAGNSLPPFYRQLELLPVHRLDQYTSGVFCMAANPAAREHLINQLRNHTMKREYVALAEGHLKESKGTWRNWLQLSHDELRQIILSESQAKAARSEVTEAITHYEVEDEYPFPAGKTVVSRLRLRLETGRKHQIRVQAAHAGVPLVGDRTYNLRGAVEFPRQALHAETLSLEHPGRPGERMTWKAEMAKDMHDLENFLKTG